MTPNKNYLREIISIIAILFVIAGCVWQFWDYIPGTLRRDENGFTYGTGTDRYYYKSGQLKIEGYYRAGKMQKTTWFDPSGNVIQQTDWINESGEGLYLREDGTIKTRMQYKNNMADGKAIYYHPDGSVEKEVWYKDGQVVNAISQPSPLSSPSR